METGILVVVVVGVASGGGGLLGTEEGESETETEIWLEAADSFVAGRCEGERGGGAGPSEAGIGER